VPILLLREGGIPALLIAALVWLVRFLWTTPPPPGFSLWPRFRVELTFSKASLTSAAAVALKSARIWRGDKRIPSSDSIEDDLVDSTRPARRRDEDEDEDDHATVREDERTPRILARRDQQRPPLVRGRGE
jgi:hypothetical protein